MVLFVSPHVFFSIILQEEHPVDDWTSLYRRTVGLLDCWAVVFGEFLFFLDVRLIVSSVTKQCDPSIFKGVPKHAS